MYSSGPENVQWQSVLNSAVKFHVRKLRTYFSSCVFQVAFCPKHFLTYGIVTSMGVTREGVSVANRIY
jgi:hypothetical protein